MEAKLLAQLRCRIDEPLFMVFVGLKKAYYSLDREQAMRKREWRWGKRSLHHSFDLARGYDGSLTSWVFWKAF